MEMQSEHYTLRHIDKRSPRTQDAQCLRCFSVPDTQALHEFVRSYFLHVHPGFPVLDEAAFWGSYTQSHFGFSKVSLFVLQALLFASSPYVSLTTLHACGFRTKPEARNTFYKRAKCMFDLNAATRPLAQGQGAALLSNHASAVEPHAGTDWLSRAIESALTINASPGPRQEEVAPILKKRLWWSVVLRDRCLCLALHRRTEMPVINTGLGIDTMDEEDFADEIMNSYVYEAHTKRALVKVLKEQYELALALSDMMPLVYASHGFRTPSLSRAAFEETLVKVRRIEATLDQWMSPTQFPGLISPNTHGSVPVFINLVYMYYYAARINLMQFELLTIEKHPEYTPDYSQQLTRAGSSLSESMHRLTGVMEFLSYRGRNHSLPLTILGCLPMPFLTTAIDIRLSSSSEMTSQKSPLHILGQFLQFLRSLEQVYEAAHALLSQIETPSEGPLPASAPTKNWKDFFLQSPRAYLLISTTVAYSLSIGHLPHDDALPDMLTSVFPGSLKIRFPWNVNPIQPTIYKIPVRRSRIPRHSYKMAKRLEALHSPAPPEDQVNLDYLDLNAAH
ncbi:fungal specific transcription factor domain-containing protein [Aspergillus lucknowensis]|uniref:Transcription factor domain-containing protein n=1 Tax=Aspergillus lucknowensis TaxID=176173 RepID=A0ABR4LYZ7_9EURO